MTKRRRNALVDYKLETIAEGLRGLATGIERAAAQIDDLRTREERGSERHDTTDAPC